MNNQMTIQTNYNMQMELALEGIIENGNQPKKKQKKLVFQPYNNKQTINTDSIWSQELFDLPSLLL